MTPREHVELVDYLRFSRRCWAVSTVAWVAYVAMDLFNHYNPLPCP